MRFLGFGGRFDLRLGGFGFLDLDPAVAEFGEGVFEEALFVDFEVALGLFEQHGHEVDGVLGNAEIGLGLFVRGTVVNEAELHFGLHAEVENQEFEAGWGQGKIGVAHRFDFSESAPQGTGAGFTGEAAHEALHGSAEGLVDGDIGPDGAAACGERAGFEDQVDFAPEGFEEFVDAAEVFGKGFAAAHLEEDEAGAEDGDFFQIEGPGFVHGFQTSLVFGIAEEFFALLEKGMALAFEDAFVFVEKFACAEVHAFDAALEFFGGDAFAGFAVFEEQFIFEGDEEAGGAGVALPAGAAAELAIDAAGFVAEGADDVEAAEIGNAVAEADIDAAASHIGGDGDGAAFAGASDEAGFGFFVGGVENDEGDAGEELA